MIVAVHVAVPAVVDAKALAVVAVIKIALKYAAITLVPILVEPHVLVVVQEHVEMIAVADAKKDVRIAAMFAQTVAQQVALQHVPVADRDVQILVEAVNYAG
ncbi:hypothetical protein FACS1894181_04680 [Bacteroidia bacterium]|nr:hypothetical protein FACS1894181_04680 [Bacteroidia bacterium]